ncbi:MAG: tyrosine protein phosphatase [Micromonosporaceae bacterium]|nr:tyrosine protein phosphatase [Micromonosporaceae bacterium]
MAHPPGGRELPAAMARLSGAGARVLVSALCDDEVAELALTGAPAAAAAAGLELIRFPIVDRGVPEPGRWRAVDRLVDRLVAELRADRFVVTHCWAGIGRSSLLAGATLVRLGVPPDQAWQLIRSARGLPVPDNRDQEAWLHRFAAGTA